MPNIFRLLGQAVGFFLACGLAVEGVPCDPLAVARDIGKAFDDSKNLHKHLFDVLVDMSGLNDVKDLVVWIVDDTGLLKAKTINEVKAGKLFNAFVQPRIRSIFKNIPTRELSNGSQKFRAISSDNGPLTEAERVKRINNRWKQMNKFKSS